MSALGLGFQQQLEQLQFYKQQYEKLRRLVQTSTLPQSFLSNQEFDAWVEEQTRLLNKETCNRTI